MSLYLFQSRLFQWTASDLSKPTYDQNNSPFSNPQFQPHHSHPCSTIGLSKSPIVTQTRGHDTPSAAQEDNESFDPKSINASLRIVYSSNKLDQSRKVVFCNYMSFHSHLRLSLSTKRGIRFTRSRTRLPRTFALERANRRFHGTKGAGTGNQSVQTNGRPVKDQMMEMLRFRTFAALIYIWV
jgi:hypothetical protein